MHGEPDADAAIDASYDFGLSSARRPDMAVFRMAHQYATLLEREEMSSELVEFSRQLSERTRYPTMIAAYAVLLVNTGQPEAAAGLFDELADTGFAHPTNNVAWLHFAGLCAILCAGLSRRDCVPVLRSRLATLGRPTDRRRLRGWVSGPVSFHLGLLATTSGEWEEAEGYFAAAAAATVKRIAAPNWLARTRVDGPRCSWPKVIPATLGQAAELLRQAVATARERGSGETRARRNPHPLAAA